MNPDIEPNSAPVEPFELTRELVNALLGLAREQKCDLGHLLLDSCRNWQTCIADVERRDYENSLYHRAEDLRRGPESISVPRWVPRLQKLFPVEPDFVVSGPDATSAEDEHRDRTQLQRSVEADELPNEYLNQFAQW